MSTLALIAFLIIPSFSKAGQFVQKNMYSNAHLAVGVGNTMDQAKADAMAAIPIGSKEDFYEPDSNYSSPFSQCTNGVEWTEIHECWEGGTVQYVIPLRHVTR